jgi:ribonuclease III
MHSEPHDLSALEEALGHRFQRRVLLQQAVTHSSYAREMDSQNAAERAAVRAADNEQMEFLGDAVLGFVVSRELFQRFPEYQEGELSKLRAHLVSARHLLRPARELAIGQYLRLGNGEERSGGRGKVALLVNALEAVIAALFLDAGLETAQRFIQQSILEPGLAEVHRGGSQTLPVIDYKSALQEAVHANGRSQPRYVLIKEEGPDHRKVFTMEAQVPAAPNGEEGFARRAEGNTKKLAEQRAAREAWNFLQSLKSGPGLEDTDPPGEISEHS